MENNEKYSRLIKAGKKAWQDRLRSRKQVICSHCGNRIAVAGPQFSIKWILPAKSKYKKRNLPPLTLDFWTNPRFGRPIHLRCEEPAFRRSVKRLKRLPRTK